MPVLEETTAWAARTFDRTRRPADGHDFWGAGPGEQLRSGTRCRRISTAPILLSGNAAVQGVRRRLALRGLLAAIRRNGEPDRGAAGPRLQPRQFVQQRRHGLRRQPAIRAILQICANAYDFLQRTQCYATGGYGPDERLMPPDGSLGRSLELYGYHAEIPCGIVGGFKLSRT